MPKERDTPDDLYPFAQMRVKELKRKYQLRWNEHRMEDAERDLFLAGWYPRKIICRRRNRLSFQLCNGHPRRSCLGQQGCALGSSRSALVVTTFQKRQARTIDLPQGRETQQDLNSISLLGTLGY